MLHFIENLMCLALAFNIVCTQNTWSEFFFSIPVYSIEIWDVWKWWQKWFFFSWLYKHCLSFFLGFVSPTWLTKPMLTVQHCGRSEVSCCGCMLWSVYEESTWKLQFVAWGGNEAEPEGQVFFMEKIH